ncbi:hypothetical protein FSC11_15085 (plasmid) [Acinetobacter schindleri]|nr:hypothetical protein FSC11_15085 [Acinetobacter schindleri]
MGTGTTLSNWTSSYIDSNFRCSPKPYLKKLLKKWELKAPIFISYKVYYVNFLCTRQISQNPYPIRILLS